MSNVWAEFPPVPAVGTAVYGHERHAVATVTQFPEWDAGGFRKPLLPIGLRLGTGADSVIVQAVPQTSSTDLEANRALWQFLGKQRPGARQDGYVVRAYFAERPDLIARLARVRNGMGKLTDRLNTEFRGPFLANEVGQLGMLVPLSGWTGTPQHHPNSKAQRRAYQAEEAARKAAESARRAAEEAARQAEAKRRFREKCQELAASGEPEAIVDFALGSRDFEKLVGVAIVGMLSATSEEDPPDLAWSSQPAIELPGTVRDAVTATCVERWRKGRADYLLALKRSASALKAAETRRARTAAKRAIEEAEERVRAAENRRAALPRALAAREQGPDVLVALLAEDAVAQSLLKLFPDEATPLLTLTEAELEAEQRRKQADIDRQGIWRKDIHARCPWLTDSEIETLYKQGTIKVLRTVEIKKNGRWIDARLYDPVTVRRCTREWVEQWRENKKRRG